MLYIATRACSTLLLLCCVLHCVCALLYHVHVCMSLMPVHCTYSRTRGGTTLQPQDRVQCNPTTTKTASAVHCTYKVQPYNHKTGWLPLVLRVFSAQGADNAMLETLNKDTPSELVKRTEDQIHEFAREVRLVDLSFNSKGITSCRG